MKKRTFIIKVLRLIAIILLLPTLLVIAIKIWALHFLVGWQILKKHYKQKRKH